MHRSPDGFRGRACLVSSLMALQTVLSAAAAVASPSPRISSSGGNDDDDPAGTTSITQLVSASPLSLSPRRQQQQLLLLLLRGDSCFARSGSSAAPATFDCSSDGEGAGGGGGGGRGHRRLSWVLRLACHRDATVRALSLGVLAETVNRLSLPSRHLPSLSFSHPRGALSAEAEFVRESGPGSGLPAGSADVIAGSRAPMPATHSRLAPPTRRPTATGLEVAQAGEEVVQAEDNDDDDAEAVRVCVRAALDGHYESPAVVAEALRFLCRHANTRFC